jgi:hypothetical protein
MASVVREGQNVTLINVPEIHKYFGDSTPQGLEFQFREKRREAKALREGLAIAGALNSGDSPQFAQSSKSSSMVSTPQSGMKRKTMLTTPTSRTPSSKRTKKVVKYAETDTDKNDEEVDYEQLDQTPTRKKVYKTANPPLSVQPPPVLDFSPAKSSSNAAMGPATPDEEVQFVAASQNELAQSDEDFQFVRTPKDEPLLTGTGDNPVELDGQYWGKQIGNESVLSDFHGTQTLAYQDIGYSFDINDEL